MPTIGTSSKPAYVYDAGTDTWIPIGPGEHTHAYVEKSTLTTTGDLVYASAANTPARLGIGSTGQVLTVSGGVPAWSAPASGGKILQVVSSTDQGQTAIASTTFTDTGLTASITPSSSNSKILILITQHYYFERSANEASFAARIMRGSTEIYSPYTSQFFTNRTQSVGSTYQGPTALVTFTYLDSPATTSSTTYKTQAKVPTTANGGQVITEWEAATGSIILMEVGA